MAVEDESCMSTPFSDFTGLAKDIRIWARDLGFDGVGITDTRLDEHEARLINWLDAGFHGEMQFMSQHGRKRSRPEKLVPGTVRIISVRMNYQPPDARNEMEVLSERNLAYISRYALGRDYHRLIRKRLQKLAERITAKVGPFGYRAFTDSAPVLERALAEKAGLGWIGKHTNLINRASGSWFFLGELYTDLPLPPDGPSENHCGTCSTCMEVCPTQAIIAPYRLDARRCISYHTIELKGAIPVEFRPSIGNRIFGCDDCQLFCPWNRFGEKAKLADFAVRHRLDAPDLVGLFAWSEEDFLSKTQGSAIRRIGYACWLRNIAVALGNAESTAEVIRALNARRHHPNEMVREHVAWALQQHAGA